MMVLERLVKIRSSPSSSSYSSSSFLSSSSFFSSSLLSSYKLVPSQASCYHGYRGIILGMIVRAVRDDYVGGWNTGKGIRMEWNGDTGSWMGGG